MLNRFRLPYSATFQDCNSFMFPFLAPVSLQLHVGGGTRIRLAVCDPHHVELHNHLAYLHLEARYLQTPPDLWNLPLLQV